MRSSSRACLLTQPKRVLVTILWLVSLHSFSMGIGLIVQPDSLIEFLGFEPIREHFFPAQGGAFHILMGIAYLMGACNLEKCHYLIVFAVVVKAGATLFLTLYCIIAEFRWFILFCATVDAAMGGMIFLYFLKYLKLKALPKIETYER